jgi:7-cyano-7-deazaguanine synthase
MQYKKLAITGANGYLGQYSIKMAIQKGWDIVGIVRREDAAKEVESLGAKSVIIKDFNLEAVKEAIIGCKAVLHFRGIVCGSKELFEKVNVEGMRILVKAAEDAKVSRIIFPSGLGVDRFRKEEWANNVYFYSKNEAELILKKANVNYIIFRPSYILGPNDELIPEMVNQIGKGIINVAGDGKIPIQPIYVKNAVKAFLAAADGVGKINQTYDLVGPKVINMIELVDLVVENMVDLGFNVPPPRINFISYEAAPEVFGICKEMVDVMKCNITSDGNVAAEALGYKLSNINAAIKEALYTKLCLDKKQLRKSAIVLLSGGIDSAVALHWAYQEGYDIIALSYNYYLRPQNEKKAAQKLAENLQIKIIEVPLPFIKESIDLRIEKFPIPSAINAPEGFIPTRNLIFYSIAGYYAEVFDCEVIIGGHITTDQNDFPDASSNFFKSLEKLINKGKHVKDKSRKKLLFPLADMTKKDVINLGIKLRVPLEWTWSCYSDGDKHCGKCNSCRKRNEALSNLNYSNLKFAL